MKIVFYASDKPRELDLAKAFAAGAKRYRHEVEIRSVDNPLTLGVDLSCMAGVKSNNLWHFLGELGCRTMMFDKGYSRHRKGGTWEYWRVSLGAHHPTETTLLQHKYPSDRFDSRGWVVEPWRKTGDHILIAGSSPKYHDFYRLGDPTKYAEKIIETLRTHTSRTLVYRPKPSWRDARHIDGSIYSNSKQPLASVLDDCHAVITHGSNCCFEAALMGIPSIVLGDGVMKSISSTKLNQIESLYLCDRGEVFNALAYHQWTLAEFSSGLAFDTIRKWL